MRRDRMSGNCLTRLAACVGMVMIGVGAVWGQSLTTTPINPAFKKWQKEQSLKQKLRTLNVAKGAGRINAKSNTRRLLTTVVEEEEPALGLAPDIFDTSYLANLNTGTQRGIQDDLPRRYDLREKDVLTTIKNQGAYGTCWAHAACASLESGALMGGTGGFDFSEKNLASLHGFDWDGFDVGGNAQMASAYLLRWNGPILESEDPYPDDSYYWRWFSVIGGNPRPLNLTLPKSPSISPSFHVQNIRWIAGRTSHLDNDHIKEALIANGALYVSYYHASAYYNSQTAAYHFNGNTSRRTNHAVALVGWDDDYPALNFATVPSRNGAFIVRNSGGESWGDGGYFYVSYCNGAKKMVWVGVG